MWPSAQLLDDVRPLGVDGSALLLIGAILLALGLLFAVAGRGRRDSKTPASSVTGGRDTSRHSTDRRDRHDR